MWSRSGDEAVCSRLDCFLVSNEWEEQFPEKGCQDFFLITFLFVLNLQSWRGARLRLGLRICGWGSNGFSDIIKGWWGEAEVNGFATYVVARKL